MIIVCRKCNTSFLLSQAQIKQAGQTFRCGKCRHVWKEVPLPSYHARAMEPSISADRASDFPPPPLPLETAALIDRAGAGHKTRQPVISRKALLRVLAGSGALSFALLILGLTFMLAAHDYVLKEWPQTKGFYLAIGWIKPPPVETMILRNITSERRYLDGAMQLVIEGQIANKSEKTQTIPNINVEALGADGRVIQSWRIAPSRSKLKKGEVLPFKSATIAPEGTVTEVNLNFTEQPHETE